MKLLFDHNLSPQLVIQLADLFPGSDHVYHLNLAEAQDRNVWEYARQHNFTIVTKDADFSDLSILLSSPPKVVWIRRGNCKTNDIFQILNKHYTDIQTLIEDKERSILVLF